MGEVKRYDPFGYDGLSAFMTEDNYGDYVRHDDYAALEAELDRKVWEWSSAATAEAHRVDELKAERDTLRQQLAELRDMLSGEVETNIPLRQKAFDLTEQRDKLAEILRDIVPGCKWKRMRPRIDAALAEIDHGNE